MPKYHTTPNHPSRPEYGIAYSAAMIASGAVGPSRASSRISLGVGAHFLRKPKGTSGRIALTPTSYLCGNQTVS
jgi:hypothetical protein